jgi:hypothetical protein
MFCKAPLIYHHNYWGIFFSSLCKLWEISSTKGDHYFDCLLLSLQGFVKEACPNPSLGLATKARVCKIVGQE